MVSIKNLIFLAASVCALATPPTNPTQLDGLEGLNKDILSLTDAVKGFNGGGAEGALPLKDANDKYLADVKNLLDSITNKQGSLSGGQGSDMLKFIDKVLQPSFDNYLQAIKSKKSLFEAEDLLDVVKSSLEDQQNSTEQLNSAFIKHSSILDILKLDALTRKLEEGFGSTLAFLSKKN